MHSYLYNTYKFKKKFSKSVFLFVFLVQNSSSVALLHKHLQLLLPHATDIFSRSATLIKESSWNGNIQEKLQGEDERFCPADVDDHVELIQAALVSLRFFSSITA